MVRLLLALWRHVHSILKTLACSSVQWLVPWTHSLAPEAVASIPCIQITYVALVGLPVFQAQPLCKATKFLCYSLQLFFASHALFVELLLKSAEMLHVLVC